MAAVQHSLESHERREMHAFLNHHVSSSVYEFIMSQPELEQPKTILDCIRLIEKWCEVKARSRDKDKPSIKVIDGFTTAVIDGLPYSIKDPRISAVQRFTYASVNS